MDTDAGKGTGTTQRHEQVLKNYNMKRQVRHQYDTGTTQIRYGYNTLNEASVHPQNNKET